MILKKFDIPEASAAPHIRAKWSSKWIMGQVLIALSFPTIAATYFYGLHCIEIVSTSILFCLLLEYSWQKIKKKPITILDGSATITGWLLALTVPITTPIWIIFIADFIAIILVKQLGGGIGNNLLNPAVTARVCLRLLFKPQISNFINPNVDIVTSATPIKMIGQNEPNKPTLLQLLLGIDVSGAIGETCKLVLIIAGIYLIIKKIIPPLIPVITVLAFYITLLPFKGFQFMTTLQHVFSGSLIFCAVFMVTDYTTSPLSIKGKYIFATGCGIITAIIRILPIPFPEGIGISILIMNLFTPLINKLTVPKIYGN